MPKLGRYETTRESASSAKTEYVTVDNRRIECDDKPSTHAELRNEEIRENAMIMYDLDAKGNPRH